MLNTISNGSHLLKLKVSAIALHLCCIAFKVARGRPISFHLLHVAREFGFGRLARIAKREARETFSLWMPQRCTVGPPQIQASKFLVFLAALAFALAQAPTAQSGLSEEVTVGDLGNPNDPLLKVPDAGAVPSGYYILEVVSGSGDGIYPTGRRVKVSADAPPAGQKFAGWAGDTGILSNPFLPTTTAIIPSMDVALSATYADPERVASSEPTPTPTPEPTPSPTPTPTTTPTPDKCPCIDDPADCFLEYSSAKGANIVMNGARFKQQFSKQYWVKIKSKSGKNTCDCHIIQAAIIHKIYLNPRDAKPNKPGDFKKPANDPGFFSYVLNLPLIGPVVVSGDRDDYTEKDNVCINNEQTINDKPGYNLPPRATKNEIRFWTFTAQDWVKEVPSVKGTISMTASFKWTPPLSAEWSALSDPGNVKESGTWP
jgi:hypothetical protein